MYYIEDQKKKHFFFLRKRIHRDKELSLAIIFLWFKGRFRIRNEKLFTTLDINTNKQIILFYTVCSDLFEILINQSREEKNEEKNYYTTDQS